jgi:hypothetical protein
LENSNKLLFSQATHCYRHLLALRHVR